MQKEPAVRSLTIQNLLSFGEERTTIDLRPLNVLIGPNGSGKSNLIEVLGLLQSAPKELGTTIAEGGLIDDWLWKGASRSPVASIEATVSRPMGPTDLLYRLGFKKVGFRFRIVDERIADQANLYYKLEGGRAVLVRKGKKIARS